MLYKTLRILAFILFGFSLPALQAQQSLSAAGGKVSGNGGSISYSIGQLHYQIHKTDNGSLHEGVQHPYEISIVSVADNAGNIALDVMAYPNPTRDILILDIDNWNTENLIFQLYDSKGKLIKSQAVNSKQTKINMSQLLPAYYMARIIQDDKKIKTFKIFKH